MIVFVQVFFILNQQKLEQINTLVIFVSTKRSQERKKGSSGIWTRDPSALAADARINSLDQRALW